MKLTLSRLLTLSIFFVVGTCIAMDSGSKLPKQAKQTVQPTVPPGQRELYQAYIKPDYPRMKQLIDQGVNPHWAGHNGWSVFRLAFCASDLQAMAIMQKKTELQNEVDDWATAESSPDSSTSSSESSSYSSPEIERIPFPKRTNPKNYP